MCRRSQMKLEMYKLVTLFSLLIRFGSHKISLLIFAVTSQLEKQNETAFHNNLRLIFIFWLIVECWVRKLIGSKVTVQDV